MRRYGLLRLKLDQRQSQEDAQLHRLGTPGAAKTRGKRELAAFRRRWQDEGDKAVSEYNHHWLSGRSAPGSDPAPSVKRYDVPAPDRPTACGLPPPLSLTESEAVRLPFVCGVKVRLIEHDWPPPRLEPQVLVWEKSLGFEPVTVIDVTLTLDLPLLVIVTDCELLLLPTFTLPKFKLAGEISITVPVPERLTFCGLPEALSVMDKLPLWLPWLVGVKVT
jgi:hypothetical protein